MINIKKSTFKKFLSLVDQPLQENPRGDKFYFGFVSDRCIHAHMVPHQRSDSNPHLIPDSSSKGYGSYSPGLCANDLDSLKKLVKNKLLRSLVFDAIVVNYLRDLSWFTTSSLSC
jgi:hypothetical protein